jgi:hypothetical protein
VNRNLSSRKGFCKKSPVSNFIKIGLSDLQLFHGYEHTDGETDRAILTCVPQDRQQAWK